MVVVHQLPKIRDRTSFVVNRVEVSSSDLRQCHKIVQNSTPNLLSLAFFSFRLLSKNMIFHFNYPSKRAIYSIFKNEKKNRRRYWKEACRGCSDCRRDKKKNRTKIFIHICEFVSPTSQLMDTMDKENKKKAEFLQIHPTTKWRKFLLFIRRKCVSRFSILLNFSFFFLFDPFCCNSFCSDFNPLLYYQIKYNIWVKDKILMCIFSFSV